MFYRIYINEALRIRLLEIEPFFAKHPWTRVLKGKKVLVIHPFAPLIEKQYLVRNKLFSNPEMLPDFNLRTVQAVQSIGGESNGYKDCSKLFMLWRYKWIKKTKEVFVLAWRNGRPI